jgi:two-component system sensor histidine kinase PilS (NtrC family)
MITSSLRSKLLWLTAARAVVVTCLLGSATLAQIRSPGALPIDPFFFLIALTYGLTAVYSLLLKKAEQYPWMVDVQLACDALIVSATVCMTGGIVSYFSTLYTLPIIAASTIRSRRGGVMVGVLSSIFYIALVLGQYSGISPESIVAGLDVLPPLRIALFSVGLSVFGFLAVAALSGYLAEGLRRADAQLQQASSRLADLQAFSQHVIDSLASGLATTDGDGQIITFNRAAEAITGISAGSAVGQSIVRVLQWPGALGAFFTSRDPDRALPRVEFELTRTDGRRIELGLSTAILRTPSTGSEQASSASSGRETGFVFTFRDVTDARREEREARMQQRLAAVGEMAAGIAHEIRNPLASMSGSIQILRQELPLTGEQAQLMDIVIRESERLNDTIRSFLAYARPQRQAASRVDVRRTVTDTAALLQNSPERLPSHTVLVDVPADVVTCLADEAQIRQVVWNLATNALRAMPDGGALRMSVAADDDGDDGGDAGYLTLAVRDEGVGIAPADLDGILQPFRGGFARGTGLGLSIVHRIVSDYGGELQVTSQPGQGTTVAVKLPAASFQPPGSSLPLELRGKDLIAAESQAR